MLSAAKLKSNLISLIHSGYDKIEDAAHAWLDSYVDYAKDGTAFLTAPNILEANKTVLESGFIAKFATASAGLPLTAATDLAALLTAFWLTPPITFGTPVPFALVSVVPGTAALATALNSTFLVIGGSEEDKATAISLAIDTFTKTIIVLNPATLVTTTII
jgi:hypothetical protein